MSSTRVRFFNPTKQYLAHKKEYDKTIQDVLKRGDLILRQDLEEFEKSLAKFLGKKHAIGMNSGTDALYLSLWALGIGEGDKVITSSHTFVASAQVIKQLGAKPVLVDCNDNLLMDLPFVTDRSVKAVIPVHLTGSVVQANNEILDFYRENAINIIEDAAQAFGAKGVGYGLTQCYSFYPAKILGAFGDAGAVTTDDDDLAEELRNLRHHYKKDYSKWGINSRLDNMQAAILNVKMKYIRDSLKRRKEIAMMYKKGLKGLPIELPEYSAGRVWQDYVIRFFSNAERNQLYEYLNDKGIETMKNDYPFPIKKCPNSLIIEAETLRIPCNDVLTNAEVERVIKTIKSYYL